MPFQYSNEQKLNALRLLFETMGDVHYVSNETGIAVRTLQYWKSHYRARVVATPEDLPDPTDQLFKEQYRFIREKLFHHVTDIMTHMENHNTPELMANLVPALVRLIDRLAKMENMITESHFTFTLTWANPEELETNPDRIDFMESLKRF